MSLKELTAEAHRLAETQPFVKKIFSGNLTNEEYAIYLYNQYTAYEILESHALVIGLLNDLPGIQRAAALLGDFKELWPDDQEVPPLATATVLYKEHINNISNNPDKLLAHMYVRHMGDLYGGQMIAKRIPGSGSCYKFDNADALKTAIRAKLDDSLAEEALVCFGFATQLFEELA
jgi:heme oxygenase